MKSRFVKRLLAFSLSAAMACSMTPAAFAQQGGQVVPFNSPSSERAAVSYSSISSVSTELLRQYAQNSKYRVPQSFLDEIAGSSSVTPAQLQQLGARHRLLSEYLQLFFPNRFVFRIGNVYKYTPIDNSLAKNDYDWSNLVEAGGNELRYIEDGVSKASKGIDVSRYQGDINWSRVRQDGVEFAIIRLGYRGYGTGKIVLDEKFHQNMRGAQAAGIPVGVYFYSQAVSTKEARQEAQFVLDNLKGYDIDYPIVFDIEAAPSAYARTSNVSAKTATDMAIAFCDTVEAAGYDSMVYSYLYYFVHNMELSRLEGYDKWVANYYDVPFFPYEFQILQYTSEGKVSGISGDTDLNLAFVNY